MTKADPKIEAAKRYKAIQAQILHLQIQADAYRAQAAGPASWGAVGSLGHIQTVLGDLLGEETR